MSVAQEISRVFVGTFVHSKSKNALEILHNTAIGLSSTGAIAFLKDKASLSEIKTQYGIADDKITIMKEKQFFLPGFVDTHSHAPQYLFTGTGYDLTLLDWLKKYVFPVESKFKDTEYAKTAYRKVVQRSIANGTTTNCYFATVHHDASMALVEIVEEKGQRAFVGKVNMDRNSPDFYIETTEESIRETRKFVTSCAERKPTTSPKVIPVITPRFVPTCTSELMNALGDIAVEFDLPITSHLSENTNEIAWVGELHPECNGYADVYDKHKLFTDRTIMAHCVYLEDYEIELAKERGVGISHCPNSNFSLNSGCLNVRNLLDKDVKIGLGTDYSGGYSPSMIDSMRQAIICSKAVFFQNKNCEPLSYPEAIYLATRGGAELMGMQSEIGQFKEGMKFDALLIDPECENSPIDLYEGDSWNDYISKFVYLGDDRNIVNVFIDGRLVK